MSQGNVSLGISGDSAGAQRAFDSLNKEVIKLREQVKSMGDVSKQSTREQDQLARAAKRVFEETRTPAEQYRAQMARLNSLVASGAIDQETYGRAVAKVNLQIIANSDATKRMAESEAAVKRQSEEAAKALKRQHDEVAMAAKRVFDDSRTPMERYRAQMKDLGSLLNTGAISYETYGRAAKQAHSEMKSSAGDSAGILGSMASSVTSIVAGYVGWHTVIQLVNSELRNTVELRQQQADATKTEAEAQRDFLRNLGAETPQERDKAIGRLDAISKETGVSRRDLYLRASAIFSSKGNLPEETAWSSLRESARFIPENMEMGRALGVGSLDLARAMGTTDARRTTGLMALISRLSHIDDWQKVAQYGAPAVAGAMSGGAQWDEAAALFSALTYGRQDWHGRMTRGGLLGITRQLGDYLPEKDKKLYREHMGQMVHFADRKGTGMTSLSQRLEHLWKNPEEAEKFYQFADIDATMKPALRELLGLQGEGTKGATKQSFKDMLAELRSRPDLAAYFEGQLGIISGTPEQQASGFGRRLGSLKESLLVSNPVSASRGFLEKELPDILKASGESALGQKIAGYAQTLTPGSSDAIDSAIGDIQSRIAAHKTPMYLGASGVANVPTSEADAQQIKLLKDVIGVLNEMKGELQRTNRKQNVSASGATNTHSER